MIEKLKDFIPQGFYHESDGLLFRRLEGGDVEIIKCESAHDEAPVVFRKVIKKDIWLSVICSVSAEGEHHGRYAKAEEFHQGPKP